MSTTQTIGEVADWCLQACPICGRENYMVVRGHKEINGRLEIYPDIGYSFCNCHNIFYSTYAKYNNPIQELKDAFDRLNINNEYVITVPDPFFVRWEDPHEFKHWNPRDNACLVIWDIESLCDVIEKCGFIVVGCVREFDENSPTPQTSTIIFGKDEMTPRASFAAVQKHFKAPIIAVEVGTHTGRNAEKMLKYLPIAHLTLVDHWEAYSDFPIQKWQDQNMHIVMEKFEKDDRVKILKGHSVDKAKDFEDESVDFVYIDAAHDYESVKADIIAWRPKVKKGGILAGHDYIDLDTPDVKKAVDEAFGEKNIHHGKNYNAIHDWWVFL